jgi:hypothetical protein
MEIKGILNGRDRKCKQGIIKKRKTSSLEVKGKNSQINKEDICLPFY